MKNASEWKCVLAYRFCSWHTCIYFAVDNIDFAEDIPDGKHTLHATAISIYQQCEPTDVTCVVEVKGSAKDCSSLIAAPAKGV